MHLTQEKETTARGYITRVLSREIGRFQTDNIMARGPTSRAGFLFGDIGIHIRVARVITRNARCSTVMFVPPSSFFTVHLYSRARRIV